MKLTKIKAQPKRFRPIGSNGFTLLEALITVIITSIGLLGLSAMQAASIRFTYDSYLRTQTSFMASDLFDRMRANPEANYTNASVSTSTDCASTECDANTMMQYDFTKWRQQRLALFPDSEVTVSAEAGAVHTYTIAFKWNSRTTDGDIAGSTDNRQTLTYVARVKE